MNGFRAFPPVVQFLLIGNVVMFFVQQSAGIPVLAYLALWPIGTELLATPSGPVIHFLPWQIATYSFLHGNVTHLFFNMFALWMFGVALEHAWGSQRFAIYYSVCVVGAALVQLVVVTLALQEGGFPAPTIGASGGVFGVLLAFGVMYPNRQIMLLIPPIPIKAKYFVIFYGLLELVLGISSTNTGVAHFAHLGGMVFGFILLQYWRRPSRS